MACRKALGGFLWLRCATPLLLVIILQVATSVSNFTMQIISQRSAQLFFPARDYSWFVARLEMLYKRA
jgi:hypothetical protein